MIFTIATPDQIIQSNLNPILYIIYYLLKGLVKLTLRCFYGRITILNRERFKLNSGPYILVSNHPNTLIDPLWTASEVNRVVFFLANAGLFKKPFNNWFFTTFFCIRIERPTDVGGRPLDNEASFVLSSRHLQQNGVLYIAPEAYSFQGRKLMPLKTGTMRIAMAAEQKDNFQLGVRILPVGLNYESPYDFRSDLLIRVGEPLTIGDYAEAYSKDPYETVRTLTKELEDRIADLIIATRDAAEDLLLQRLEMLLRHDDPLPPAEHHFRARRLLAELQRQRAEKPTEWSGLAERTAIYFGQLENYLLSDHDIAHPGSCRLLRRSFSALISLPVFLYGWINNYLPAFIPAWIQRKLQLDLEYDGTVKMLAGLITFPVFYFLQYAIVQRLLPPPYPLLYLLSLAPLGLCAWELKQRYDRLRSTWRFQVQRRKQPDLIRKLIRERAQLAAYLRGLEP